ncbi:MAG: hypothetical protein ABI542_11615 [Gemmatimonadota bacterium]
MATTLRIEAELNDTTSIQQVERLKALLGAGNSELIRNALLLLDWTVGQVAEGRQLASVSDGSVAREFSMPLLERARGHTRVSLETAAFGRLVEALRDPPEPSEALRALVAEHGVAPA